MPHNNQFESAFGEFLEQKVYDEAKAALFSVVRAAFQAGWDAAKKEAAQPNFLYVLPQQYSAEP